MRTAFLLAAACLAAGGSAARLPAQTAIATGRATADRDVSLRILNLEGAVRVTGWDRDSIAVVGSLDVPRGIEGFYLAGNPNRRGFKLGVHTDAEGRPVGSARLEVHVPRDSRVWIKTNGAAIDVDDVRGGLDLYSVSGPVRVSGRVDQLSIESMDGDVEITAAAGWLRIKTADGRALLSGSADDAAVSTVSGPIVVEGGRYARARFESVTGGVELQGALARGGSYSFETHSGPVTLRLAPDPDATVAVSTFGGDVRSDFGRPPASGETIRLGNGEATVSIRTFRGAVSLRRR
jgi:DUF4097 and DUF4098 domain-containing protein YvlB